MATQPGVIIVCRLHSTRLPMKALLPLGNYTVIERCIVQSKMALPLVVLATSTHPQDDELCKAVSQKVNIFRGAENDVVERVYSAAVQFGVDPIVRVTGDTPFVSFELIDELVKSHVKEGADYSYWENGTLGVTCDVCSLRSLKKLIAMLRGREDTEYFSLFFKNNPELFKINKQTLPEHIRSDARLNLDYPEDYSLQKTIVEQRPECPMFLKELLSTVGSISPPLVNSDCKPIYIDSNKADEIREKSKLYPIRLKVDAPLHFIDLDWRGFDLAASQDYVEILVTDPGSKTMYDKKCFDSYPNLHAVATPSTGVTHIDVNYCQTSRIPVLNMLMDRIGLEDIHASAEFTWIHVLNSIRNFSQSILAVESGHWRDLEDTLRGHELHGKKIGIIGLGRIGRKVAKFAYVFGMNVRYYDPYCSDDQFTRVHDLYDLCDCDIITVNPYLTTETKKMINAEFLRACKKGVHIINTSRGEIVDELAVCDAVEDGHIHYSADVVCCEQSIAKFHKSRLFELAKQRKVTITPHIAGATYESQIKAMKSMQNIILDYCVARSLS